MAEIDDTIYSVGADEFEDPEPMNVFYCEKISEDQFDDEASCETRKALEVLIQYLESQPETYYRILQKRKQDEMEDTGFLSLLKLKLMKSIQGQSYMGDQVDAEECHNKLNDLKNGMLMAYKYSQETRGQRFSKRLAAKRRKLNQAGEEEKENILTPKVSQMAAIRLPSPIAPGVLSKKVPPGPPPLPPCPPPAITPFKQRSNITSTPYQIAMRPPLRKRTDSCTSLESIHQELMACDHVKRLKAVHSSKSPGGNPCTPRTRALTKGKGGLNLDSSYSNPLDSSEPLSKAFIRILERKFRNIRSPSPAVNSRDQSFDTSGFTP